METYRVQADITAVDFTTIMFTMKKEFMSVIATTKLEDLLMVKSGIRIM